MAHSDTEFNAVADQMAAQYRILLCSPNDSGGSHVVLVATKGYLQTFQVADGDGSTVRTYGDQGSIIVSGDLYTYISGDRAEAGNCIDMTPEVEGVLTAAALAEPDTFRAYLKEVVVGPDQWRENLTNDVIPTASMIDSRGIPKGFDF